MPEVFHYQLESDPRNKVNVTYILMERRPGHPLPVLEHEDCEPDPKDLALAKKVHVQLTDVILQLGGFVITIFLVLSLSPGLSFSILI